MDYGLMIFADSRYAPTIRPPIFVSKQRLGSKQRLVSKRSYVLKQTCLHHAHVKHNMS
jgi:hypothetical protein